MTGYFIDVTIERKKLGISIDTKYVSSRVASKYPNLYLSNQLHLHAPEVIGGNQACLRRFFLSMSHNDKFYHVKGIEKIQYAANLKLIFCLDKFVDKVIIYD